MQFDLLQVSRNYVNHLNDMIIDVKTYIIHAATEKHDICFSIFWKESKSHHVLKITSYHLSASNPL